MIDAAQLLFIPGSIDVNDSRRSPLSTLLRTILLEKLKDILQQMKHVLLKVRT